MKQALYGIRVTHDTACGLGQRAVMITWFYGRVSCKYIVEGKICGQMPGLLPEPETLAFHHQRQYIDDVIQAGHRDK